MSYIISEVIVDILLFPIR